MADEGERTQYQVAYFPPDGRDRTKVFEDEDKARTFFEERKDFGEAPILSERQIITTEWRMVENSITFTASNGVAL